MADQVSVWLMCFVPRMQHLKEKFKLDKIAETRLSDILARCSAEKKDEYYHDLERPCAGILVAFCPFAWDSTCYTCSKSLTHSLM